MIPTPAFLLFLSVTTPFPPGRGNVFYLPCTRTMASNKLKQPFKTLWVVLHPGWEGRAMLRMVVGLNQDAVQGLVTLDGTVVSA